MFPLLVTAAIIEHDGKILLTRRKPDAPYPLLWEFPGGKLEPFEDPADCVVREVREELDIDVEVLSVYDVVYHRYPERTVLILAYRCRWVGRDLRELDVSGHVWSEPEKITALDLLPADVELGYRVAREFAEQNDRQRRSS